MPNKNNTNYCSCRRRKRQTLRSQGRVQVTAWIRLGLAIVELVAKLLKVI